ncbi:dihydrodipicolinate reductase C-terminal domain-containing protein [Amycolatopsis sp. cmx-4-68]|uniref:dihydrodipicolinate reductase C-terminal domain-containing protein n=1 Tax=Amycolatopsis sp. cmx-4-68 TaxID=2790938 RepID=UPI0039799A03
MPEAAPTIGVAGLGRLGTAVLDRARRQGLRVVLRASRTGWQADAVPDVLVDASAPAAGEQVRDYCLRHGVALVECVSDLDARQWSALAELAAVVPVVRATNLTVGHYVQSRLVRCVAALPEPVRAPASVWERHPATKAHRPSATAVALGRTWTDGSGAEPSDISSQRSGLPVSEHEVLWTWQAETLALRHSVGSLAAAAAGAVTAVCWAHGRPAGMASMDAVYDDLMGIR